jgi:predicted ATP-grasp superfamily ATP-dependent carboligase
MCHYMRKMRACHQQALTWWSPARTHVQANGVASKPRGVLGSFVSSLALRVVGSSALTAEDLAPALVDMKVR